MKNLKKHIHAQGILLWHIADKIGVADTTLSRWLRHPTEEQEARILAALAELKGGVADEG